MINLNEIVTAEELIQAYKNATPAEQKDFIDVVVNRHLFELMSPAQFETLKRMRA